MFWFITSELLYDLWVLVATAVIVGMARISAWTLIEISTNRLTANVALCLQWSTKRWICLFEPCLNVEWQLGSRPAEGLSPRTYYLNDTTNLTHGLWHNEARCLYSKFYTSLIVCRQAKEASKQWTTTSFLVPAIATFNKWPWQSLLFWDLLPVQGQKSPCGSIQECLRFSQEMPGNARKFYILDRLVLVPESQNGI